MLKLFKFFLLTMVIILNVSVVHSFVAMDPAKALHMDMIGRDGAPRKKTSSTPAPAPAVPSSSSVEGSARTIVIEGSGDKLPSSFDDNIDKEGILKQLFPQKSTSRKQEQIKAVNLDMINKTTVRTRVPVGYMIRVVVPEAEHEEWRIDSNQEIIENVDSSKHKQYRLLDFKTVKAGAEVIYLDSFDTSVEPIRPLESRIIRLSVTP